MSDDPRLTALRAKLAARSRYLGSDENRAALQAEIDRIIAEQKESGNG